LQLTYPPVFVDYPRISPDGTKVAYADGNTDAVYVVSMDGGLPRKVRERGIGGCWSPDSNSLIVSILEAIDADSGVLEAVDLRTGKVSPIPDSAGKGGSFWPAPDLLVAVSPSGFDTFDLKTNKWSHLVSSHNLDNWMQSGDGKYMYYTTGGDDPELLRVRFSDGAVEEIVSLKNFRTVWDEELGSWVGVTAEGDPVLTRNIGTQEIYDLSVRWP
jgi:hypothetical protein